MNAIDKLIAIAEGEIGYLEKKNGASLYEKTANAGSGNYTKYWAEIKPAYQGQPWCACFVTWCFVKAFGRENAKMLLGHYPYVYVPTLAALHDQNPTPKRGDIVCFFRKGEFVHTGIVTEVCGDLFRTIEGNTSGGSTIIANGGGVCQKQYYTSGLWGTKFIRPAYEKIKEEEEMTAEEKRKFNGLVEEVGELTQRVDRLDKPVYAYVDENMPDWARETVTKLYGKGLIKGDENGKLNLSEDMLRMLVVNDRAGLYGE